MDYVFKILCFPGKADIAAKPQGLKTKSKDQENVKGNMSGIASQLESFQLDLTSHQRVTSGKPAEFARNRTNSLSSSDSSDPWEKRVVYETMECNHIEKSLIDEAKTAPANDVSMAKRVQDTCSVNDCNHVDKLSTGVDKPSTGASSSPSPMISDNTLPVHKNRTQFVKPDLLVPWHLKVKTRGAESPSPSKQVTCSGDSEQSVVYHRYYHVFKEGELEKLCLSVGSTRIVQSYYDQGNWCVVFQKL